jgi:hypothetical protein
MIADTNNTADGQRCKRLVEQAYATNGRLSELVFEWCHGIPLASELTLRTASGKLRKDMLDHILK